MRSPASRSSPVHLVKQGVLASIDVARAVLVTAGRPALSRGLAVGAAIGVVGTIVFAGNGMKASDLVHLFHVSWGVRASLWAAWTLLATPAIASAFDAPGTRILRSLGIA